MKLATDCTIATYSLMDKVEDELFPIFIIMFQNIKNLEEEQELRTSSLQSGKNDVVGLALTGEFEQSGVSLPTR
jgi:hypothetical protein